MFLPIAAATTVFLIFSSSVLLWPLTIKPALRRRYEREHLRKKAAARSRN